MKDYVCKPIPLKVENFQLKNFDIFLIFVQNIDCGYTLEPPRQVLTSIHNLCFGAKIRQLWFTGVFIARTCFPDGNIIGD